MKSVRIDCIVMAAGRSIRMNAWKPLLPFGSGVVIDAVIDAAERSDLRIILVVGYRGEELAARFRGRRGITVATNPDWERGQTGSLLCGFRRARSDFVFAMAADLPLVGPSVYRRLLEAAARRADSGLPAVPLFPAFAGRTGHPVLIPKPVAKAASALSPDAKMQTFLLSRGGVAVETPDPTISMDIDTIEDYQAALAYLSDSGSSRTGTVVS